MTKEQATKKKNASATRKKTKKKHFKKDLTPSHNSFTAGWLEATGKPDSRKDEHSQDGPLPYNPPEVDCLLLKMIEAGDYKLTDNLFSQLIGESPQYLAAKSFQDKINLWQMILHDRSESKANRRLAKERLLHIGTVLAYQERGRPEQMDCMLAYMKHAQIKERLEPFLEETKGLYNFQKKPVFEERFPEYAEYSTVAQGHNKAEEIAKQIFVKIYPLERRQLDTKLGQARAAIGRSRAARAHQSN